jgi:hypothetical protein
MCGCRRRSAWLDSAGGGQDIVVAEGRAELIAGADRHQESPTGSCPSAGPTFVRYGSPGSRASQMKPR